MIKGGTSRKDGCSSFKFTTSAPSLVFDIFQEIFEFVDGIGKHLTRPLDDLDNVRTSMGALEELRQNEIRIDETIGPLEESYALLNK